MPSRERVEPEALDRLSAFCGLVDRAGLRLHLSLLVGHMSGENWSPPWLADPAQLFVDPGLLEVQERYIRGVVEHVQGFACVEAFDLTNEMPHFAGAARRDVVERWAGRLYRAAKEADPAARPVTLGDGAGYVLGEDTGFAASHAQDVLALHLYRSDTDPDRLVAAHGLAVGVARALAGDREVWLEEFGAPHSVFGEEQVAEWAGKVVLEARLQGAARVCWGCGLDLDR